MWFVKMEDRTLYLVQAEGVVVVLAEGLVYKVHNKISGPQLVIIVEIGTWQGQNGKYLKAKGFGGET